MTDRIKRYTQTSGAMVETFNTFDGAPTGDWVKASDYDALLMEQVNCLQEIAPICLLLDGLYLHVKESVEAVEAKLAAAQCGGTVLSTRSTVE